MLIPRPIVRRKLGVGLKGFRVLGFRVLGDLGVWVGGGLVSGFMTYLWAFSFYLCPCTICADMLLQCLRWFRVRGWGLTFLVPDTPNLGFPSSEAAGYRGKYTCAISPSHRNSGVYRMTSPNGFVYESQVLEGSNVANNHSSMNPHP